MNKDRYQFNRYEEHLLDTKEDEFISKRRLARKEEARRKADVVVPISPDIIKGNVHEKPKFKANKPARKKYSFKKLAVLLLGFAIVAAFVIGTGLKLTNLQMQKKDAEKQLQALKEKADSLTAELQELDSDEYVENAARVELHMIRDGELMYIVNPSLGEEIPEIDNTVKTK